MPHDIGWSDETKTIVRQVYSGQVGRHDFETMVMASQNLLNSVSHPVDLMVECCGENLLPQDTSIIHVAMFAEKYVASNQRFVFIINLSRTISVLFRSLKWIAPHALGNLYFVDSVEAAYSLRAVLLETETNTLS